MFPVIGYVAIGLVAGVCGGALGLGGGAVMVPVMVIALGLSQQQAQGTALAVMMLPVFIPAVYRYYVSGNVNVQMALFVGAGFIVGALIGANVAQQLPEAQLRRIFGIFLAGIGIKMAFFK
jgi:uncharacterized membrane protein YfcA